MTKFNLELTSKEALVVTTALNLLAREASEPKYTENYSPEAIKALVDTCEKLTAHLGTEAYKYLVGKLTGFGDLFKTA